MHAQIFNAFFFKCIKNYYKKQLSLPKTQVLLFYVLLFKQVVHTMCKICFFFH